MSVCTSFTVPKKLDRISALKGRPFEIFQHFCRKTTKLKGDHPLVNFFSRKIPQCRKKTGKGGHPLVSPGIVCYAKKRKKPFWFSSLGQMVQFDTIKFGRTFKNYLGQLVWIEKRVSIIVAFHFMKRRLKSSGMEP